MNKQTLERYNKLIELGVREKDITMIKESKLRNFRKAWYVKRLLRLWKIENKIDYIAEILTELKKEIKTTKEVEKYKREFNLGPVAVSVKTIDKTVEQMLASQHATFKFAAGKAKKTDDLKALKQRATNRSKNKLARRAKRLNRKR